MPLPLVLITPDEARRDTHNRARAIQQLIAATPDDLDPAQALRLIARHAARIMEHTHDGRG